MTTKNLTKQELAQLKAATSSEEWNSICDRGGEYPPDWYSKVILSGLISQALAKF